MNKSELSKLLDQKVQEKLQGGYSITTYAMDAASRDRVKSSLKPPSHKIEHHNDAFQEWQEYLSKVESGTYQPEHVRPTTETPSIKPEADAVPTASSSVGQWKARRH
ncbi:hypothetical protein [Pseudomonas putida]|uniref:Uncharacterized protein n=1 Tax=Pseudomonas putida TaxID=303 RepID=A0A8I1JG12_PSEPU|nr:hypothetical protein [Pseudomonas putida]MBI6882352.1 hypothetical protein [Pseudomonas putida]